MTGSDPYVYEGTRTLRNRADIRDPDRLEEFERRFTSIRALELAKQPVRPAFDVGHFKAIHRHIFQDVYSWAGQFRTVDIAKGETSFAPVATPMHTLDTWGETILKNLEKENHLKGLDRETFVERLTHHFAEINYWHPFREGNGRTTREFFQQLSNAAGYQLDFRCVQSAEWNRAFAQAEKSTAALKDVLRNVTVSAYTNSAGNNEKKDLQVRIEDRYKAMMEKKGSQQKTRSRTIKR